MALCAIITNYHSISDFRKQNPSGLKNLFKLFVSFLKDADLIDCEIIAIDGTFCAKSPELVPIAIRRSNCSKLYFHMLVDYWSGYEVRRLRRAGFTRIAVVDQRGPAAWYLGTSQNTNSCES
jgi:hypothetical protein